MISIEHEYVDHVSEQFSAPTLPTVLLTSWWPECPPVAVWAYIPAKIADYTICEGHSHASWLLPALSRPPCVDPRAATCFFGPFSETVTGRWHPLYGP